MKLNVKYFCLLVWNCQFLYTHTHTRKHKHTHTHTNTCARNVSDGHWKRVRDENSPCVGCVDSTCAIWLIRVLMLAYGKIRAVRCKNHWYLICAQNPTKLFVSFQWKHIQIGLESVADFCQTIHQINFYSRFLIFLFVNCVIYRRNSLLFVVVSVEPKKNMYYCIIRIA